MKIFENFNYKCAIFDMDGTILDSMPFWHTVSNRYLDAHGKTYPETLWNDVKRLTLTETAELFVKNYGITDSIEVICEEFRSLIFDEYKNNLQLKEGARELLEELNRQNIPCVLATATDRKCVLACLERLDVKKYFKEIFTCLDLNTSKHEPFIFEKSAQICGATPQESLVFEDAIHCIRTAKNAGFKVCAVYDSSSDEITENNKSDWEQIIEMADCFIK